MILPVPTLLALCHRSASAPRSVSNLERDQRVLYNDKEKYEQVEGTYSHRVDVLPSTMMVMVMETFGVTVGRSSPPPPPAPVAHLRPEYHSRSHGSGRPLPAPLPMLLECRSDEDQNMIVKGKRRAISSSPPWGAVAATAGPAGKWAGDGKTTKIRKLNMTEAGTKQHCNERTPENQETGHYDSKPKESTPLVG
jgi:hypothetical protein